MSADLLKVRRTLILSLSEVPVDRVVWIRHLHPDDVDRAVAEAPPEAPAVIMHRTAGSGNESGTVRSILDEMEQLAGQLFPAWLPGAEGITTPAGAGLTAVRALALTHAAGTAQYGPFLADLAAGALTGPGTRTWRHPPEVRARGLAKVLAASLGRPASALLLRPAEHLDEAKVLVLVRAAQWLVDNGGLAVWICGESPPAGAHLLEVVVARTVPEAPVVADRPELAHRARPGQVADGQPDRSAPRGNRRPRKVAGKPHPTSRAEVVLEAALAARPWATGRLWNHTIRPGPLVNPVRVDLLWKRERCIVEIDGDDHRAAGKYTEDRRRDVMLQLSGYAVLRFTNIQVLDDIESVLALLQQFLASRRRTRKGNDLV